MARIELLREQIIEFLLENEDSLFKTIQTIYCGPCGGLKTNTVYRNPESGKVGLLLEQYRKTRSDLFN